MAKITAHDKAILAHIKERNPSAIQEFIKSTKGLSSLYLANCHLDDSDISILMDGLVDTNIINLNLSFNNIKENGACSLAHLLPNTKIQTLKLSINCLGDNGIEQLAKVLPNTHVSILLVDWCHASEESFKQLFSQLKHTKIKELSLKGNQLRSIGTIEKLTSGLEGSLVETLNLDFNTFDNQASQLLVEGLDMTNIIDLNIEHCGISDTTKRTIAEAMSLNQQRLRKHFFIKLIHQQAETNHLHALYQLETTALPKDLKKRIGESKNSLKCVVGMSADNFTLHHPTFLHLDDSAKEVFISKYLAKAKLERLKHYIDQHFSECILLFGDELIRLGLMTKLNISELKAKEKGQELFAEFYCYTRELFSNEGPCQYHIVADSTIRKWQDKNFTEFDDYLSTFQSLYENNEAFAKNVIDPFVDNYSYRQGFIGKDTLESSELLARVEKYSRQYLIEELPIFTCLLDRGFDIVIYPGEFELIYRMAQCQEPKIPPVWKNAGLLRTKFKRRKSIWDKINKKLSV